MIAENATVGGDGFGLPALIWNTTAADGGQTFSCDIVATYSDGATWQQPVNIHVVTTDQGPSFTNVDQWCSQQVYAGEALTFTATAEDTTFPTETQAGLQYSLILPSEMSSD